MTDVDVVSDDGEVTVFKVLAIDDRRLVRGGF